MKISVCLSIKSLQVFIPKLFKMSSSIFPIPEIFLTFRGIIKSSTA